MKTKIRHLLGWSLMLGILIFAVFLVGCAGTESVKTREGRCEQYVALYETYLVTTAVRPVSKEESLVALTAAVFLRTYCGWTPVRSGSDPNGVPILAPPLSPTPPVAPGASPAPRAQASRPRNDPEHVHVILADGVSFALPVEQPESP